MIKQFTAMLLVLALWTCLAAPPVQAAAPASPSLSASMDDRGTVSITGNALGPRQVAVRVLAPSGRLMYVNQTGSQPDGSFAFVFKLEHPDAGTYAVEAVIQGAADALRTTFAYAAGPEPTPMPTPTPTPTSAPDEDSDSGQPSGIAPGTAASPAPKPVPGLRELAQERVITAAQAQLASRYAKELAEQLRSVQEDAGIPALTDNAAQAISILAQLAAKATGQDVADAIGKSAMELLAALRDCGLQATASQGSIEAAADSIARSLASIPPLFGELEGAGRRSLLEQATDAAGTVTSLIRKLDSAAAALTIAERLIGGLSGIPYGPSVELAAERLADQAAAAGQTSVDKLGLVTIVHDSVPDTAPAISQADAAAILGKAEQTVQAAERLNGKLTAAGLMPRARIAAAISIAVREAGGTFAASLQLPAALFAALSNKQVEQISLRMGDSALELAPDAISLGASSWVTLLVRPVDRRTGPQVFEIEAVSDSPGDSLESWFRSHVTVRLPYALKAGEAADRITVFYLDEAGVPENMGGYYDAAAGQAVFQTNHFSKYVVQENSVRFADVDAQHWAVEAIGKLAARGIVRGKADREFAPESLVTRAEFAALLARALRLQGTGSAVFPDVSPADWYAAGVSAAFEAGLVAGDGTGFRPDAPIKREDMALITARAASNYAGARNPADPSAYLIFADAPEISEYAAAAVALAVKYGIADGTQLQTFEPRSNATRAEAAKMIAALLDLAR